MADASLLLAYSDVLLFLGTAGVVAPLLSRVHVSPVLGFLLAGALLGPYGLGRFVADWPLLAYLSITNMEAESRIAEFGLVFLLFMIGLELSWERLARLKRLVFGLGLLQTGVCSLALAVIGHVWFGLDSGPAALMGAALAMSTTAIVVPVLIESKRLAKPAGRATFSVLLMQDLMVAPLLFLVSAMANAQSGVGGLGLVTAFLPAVAAIGALIFLGHKFLRPLFHLVAEADSTELFMAACLLVIVGSSLASAAAGASMGLGAFIAGLLLAETEFRREIEVTIEPFKGLLLGLFFVSIGAGLDIGVVARDPLPIIGHAAGLILVKAALTFGLGLLFRLGPRAAGEAALLLAPGGEFAFVLLTAATLAGVLPGRHGADAMVVVTLSMFAVPLLARVGRDLGKEKPVDEEALYAHLAPGAEAAAGKVVIVGYGRVGALVGDMLKRHDIPFIVLESVVEIVARARDAGVDIYWGNATRREFLLKSGVDHARALVVTVENAHAAEEIVRVAHEARADMAIVARARDARHATTLYELGASDAIPETIEASLQLAETVLVDIGVPMGYVIASIHDKRDEYRKTLQPAAPALRQRRAERQARKKSELARRRSKGGEETPEG